jgi:hypothetical protein
VVRNQLGGGRNLPAPPALQFRGNMPHSERRFADAVVLASDSAGIAMHRVIWDGTETSESADHLMGLPA